MEVCDHFVALDDSSDDAFLVLSSEAKSLSLRYKKTLEEWAKKPYADPKVVEERKGWSAADYFMNLRQTFAFCPKCGQALDVRSYL